VVVRLSELLERIRPTGAPGAGSEGGQLGDIRAAEEISDVVRVLERFDVEVKDAIAAAHDRADRVRERAERQVGRIRSDLPRAVAEAQVTGAAAPARERDIEITHISRERDDEIERLNDRASDALPQLVEAAMNVIREDLLLAATQVGPK